MCVIENYFIVYPDGRREPHERLHWCQHGTQGTPCNQTEIVHLLQDEYALLPEAPPPPQPRYQVIEPRAARRPPEAETVKYRRQTSDGLKAVWEINIPFLSWNKKSKPVERELVVVKRGRKSRAKQSPPIIHPPPPPMVPLPPPPPPPPPPFHLGGLPRVEERFPRPVVGEDEFIQEREQRKRAERMALAEQEARIRAQEDAEKVRRQRDREKKRNSNLERDKRHREQEQQERAASAERERRRKAEDRARAESQERFRRRAAEAVRRRESKERALVESRNRARHLAEAVRLREDAERAWLERIRLEEEEEAARTREERQRITWRLAQRIPREPRHLPELHHYVRGSFEERGNRVINNAIRAEERRQAEADAGWFRRRTFGGGARRRDQVAVDERRIYI